MIAITTNSSMRVNAAIRLVRRAMESMNVIMVVSFQALRKTELLTLKRAELRSLTTAHNCDFVTIW